jgi:hypothetical protein
LVDEEDNYGLPEFLKLKYMKLVNHNPVDSSLSGTMHNLSMNQGKNSDPNFNLIKDDIWEHELFITDDLNKVLVANQHLFIDVDIWNADNHEIILRDSSKKFNRDYNAQMSDLLNVYRHKTFNFQFENTLRASSEEPNTSRSSEKRREVLSDKSSHVMMAKKPDIADIIKSSFFGISNERKNNFLIALACIINSDQIFQTNSLRRILYPQQNNLPCVSPEDIYFVKLYLNGIRRNIPVDGRFDPLSEFTKNDELYPLFLQKALKKIYVQEDLNEVLPNLMLYRLIGWIPEILFFEDIGTSDQSFEKLKESYSSFSVMLSFDFGNFVLPILDFSTNRHKNIIQTILPGSLENDPEFKQKYIVTGRLLTERTQRQVVRSEAHRRRPQ